MQRGVPSGGVTSVSKVAMASAAGVSAANFLAEKNVTIIVAGKFGSKMKDALNEKEIVHFEFKGIVGEAIKKILEKEGRT